MARFPVLGNASTVDQLGSCFVRATDKLKTAILRSLRVNYYHNFNERHFSHVVVCRCVNVSNKSVGSWQFVVNLVFEK
jgi:hypothetical protein